MQYAIETTGLSKTYRGNIRALRPIDLKVPVGCCFGLLGPNGAGKSTLIKTLLSIVRPTSGEAKLMGQCCGSPASRQGIGYLAEGHAFPRYLTGRGVCAYFGKLSGMGGSQLKQEIDKALALVGMSEWADTKISKYSKGMNQRVGLAQALLGQPRLVFLDEPTDGVDPVGRQEIRQVITRIAREGTTIFLNSHLLSEVEQTCDQIGILHKGELIQQGSVEQITASVTSDRDAVVVSLRTSPIADPVWQRLATRGATRESEASFQIGFEKKEQITMLIDELRAEQIEIYAIEHAQVNLEDAFIRLVTKEEESNQ